MLGGVLLVHLAFDLAHASGFLLAVLLTFFVPAPLVDLGVLQPRPQANLEHRFLRPVRVLVKVGVEGAQLLLGFSLPPLHNAIRGVTRRLRLDEGQS